MFELHRVIAGLRLAYEAGVLTWGELERFTRKAEGLYAPVRWDQGGWISGPMLVNLDD